MNDFLKEYKRLTVGFFDSLSESLQEGQPGEVPAVVPSMFMGGQADLTPLRNKAREAADAMAEAMRCADQGRVDDCMEAFRRAKSCIDAALGGQMNPSMPPGIASPTRP